MIGVMPEDFRFQRDPELIRSPAVRTEHADSGNLQPTKASRGSNPASRMEQANADVARMLASLVECLASAARNGSRAYFRTLASDPRLQPLKQDIVGDIGTALWVVMGTLGLVLLIACANVANLLLVRAEARQQELAIRAALGAGWRRIAREMLVESMTLGVLGGAAGSGPGVCGLADPGRERSGHIAAAARNRNRSVRAGVRPRCVFALGRALRRHTGL